MSNPIQPTPLQHRSTLATGLAAAVALAGCFTASTMAIAEGGRAPQAATSRPSRDFALSRDPERVAPERHEVVAFNESRLGTESLRMLTVGSVIPLPTALGPVRMRLVDRLTTYLGNTVLSFEGMAELGGQPGSDARLTIVDGLVTGYIRPRDGFLVELTPVDAESQRLQFHAMNGLDQGDSICGLGSDNPPLPPAGGDGGVAETCSDPASLQDVLIVVTPNAVSDLGGISAAKGKVETAIADANTALKNSKTVNRLRLVGIYVYAFPESGNIALDLTHLRVPNDGVGDYVHTLRKLYHADLVQLVARTDTSSGIAGIANLFAGIPDFGFSVVSAAYNLGAWIPAHEIGHNFGCCHAPGDGGGCESGGYFPYSNGHRFFGNNGVQYRTVMAYDPGERIPYFSNPDVEYQGKKTGIAGSTSAAADNARTFDNTAEAIAKFECGGIPEEDCNNNGNPDLADIVDDLSNDCNSNGVPDECDIASGFSKDLNGDDVPDECGAIPGKFFADDPDNNTTLDAFGISAAIGRGLVPVGQTVPLNAVVGSYADDAGGNNAGAAYVFNSVGAQQAKLVASDAAVADNFGWSVDSWGFIPTALVPKREFAVAGAYRADVAGDADAGAAYVFSSDNDGAWLERKKVTASDGKPSDWFGFSVNLTRIPADPYHTLSVGAPQGNNGKGAVYIYRYNDNNSTLLSKKLVLPQSVEGADFGWSLASDNFVTLITSNPTSVIQRAILAVGAPGFGDDAGRVRTYERAITANATFSSTGATVELGAALAVAGDRFGEAVALADNWLAIGAPGRDGGRGAVYVYERTFTNTWALRKTFTLDNAKPNDRLGASVSLTIAVDGAVWLAAGAPRFDPTISGPVAIDAGTALIRRKPANTSTWSTVSENLPPDRQSGDQFGTACSIYSDAGTIRALFTSPFDDDSGLNSGSAYTIVPTLP